MKMRVLPAPHELPRPCRRLLQIRCAGTAYGDFRTKSAAQAPHLPTFASMSLQIRCTGTAYGDIRTKSAAQVQHLLTFASMSLQIRRTGTAYAHFRCNFVVNPPSLRTKTPSAAGWAKPSWILIDFLTPINRSVKGVEIKENQIL